MAPKLELAYFDQHRAQLDEKLTVMENVHPYGDTITINGKPRHILSYLQDFLFTPQTSRSPITKLSGGERARLLLARLFLQPANVLVLDEPTNDLDIETVELLEERLLDYQGHPTTRQP
jgi:ATP-binding cassette subfamily F protein uup